jgi:integrase
MPVGDVTRDTLRAFFDTLKKLPPHMSKKAIYRGKSIPEIIKMDVGETISIITIEKNILPVKMFFSWLSAEGVIDKNQSDVLKPPKREVRTDEERSAFSIDDLKKLMAGLREPEVARTFKTRPERYWITMIGLFSGMRHNEISQLHTGDVVQEKGIWVFKVQEDDDSNKTLKNMASHRTVPVHKTLIDLGFIDYLQGCIDSGQPRLWMTLTLDARGKWGKNYANWFLGTTNTVGFLRKYVTTDSKKNFHSFRHTFINTLKQDDVEEVKIAELVGHKNESETMARYGKKYSVELMKETIDGLHYEGVEFLALR